MNQVSVETNVIESEASELSAVVAAQNIEMFGELSSAQLALVGGGCGIAILD
jgi:hypothetical protein